MGVPGSSTWRRSGSVLRHRGGGKRPIAPTAGEISISTKRRRFRSVQRDRDGDAGSGGLVAAREHGGPFCAVCCENAVGPGRRQPGWRAGQGTPVFTPAPPRAAGREGVTQTAKKRGRRYALSLAYGQRCRSEDRRSRAGGLSLRGDCRLPEGVVGQHQAGHRLHDRNRPREDTGIVAAACRERDFLPLGIHRLLGQADR